MRLLDFLLNVNRFSAALERLQRRQAYNRHSARSWVVPTAAVVVAGWMWWTAAQHGAMAPNSPAQTLAPLIEEEKPPMGYEKSRLEKRDELIARAEAFEQANPDHPDLDELRGHVHHISEDGDDHPCPPTLHFLERLLEANDG